MADATHHLHVVGGEDVFAPPKKVVA